MVNHEPSESDSTQAADPKPPEKPSSGIPFPFLEGERRKQSRRQNDRQGKYDRRRNRCAHCRHFQAGQATNLASDETGFCTFHQTTMTALAFACPSFETLPREPGRS